MVLKPIKIQEHINLRMLGNKKIMMVNLSNVTHTCVWGTLNEKSTSTIALVIKTYTHASIDIEGHTSYEKSRNISK
jgi:hypothetical protein